MIDLPSVRKLIELAITEDLSLGDVTAALTIPIERRSQARIVAREKLVFCGAELIELIIATGRWEIDVTSVVSDGAWSESEDVLATLSGSSRHMLEAERTILNFLQRLSGVATKTRRVVESLGESKLSILDTRKTLPGWRMLDKYAVRIGGARNHRMTLGDMVLVKNNHIDAHEGGIRGALSAIVKGKPLYMSWEVEVRNLDELSVALEFEPTIVMLDNFSDEAVREAIGVIRQAPRQPLIEVSGGITPERCHRLAQLGVDAVSMGSLTTAAPNVDISMRIG